jgi:hypothetical protein
MIDPIIFIHMFRFDMIMRNGNKLPRKLDDYNFSIVTISCFCGNIPSSSACICVYAHSLICISYRTCEIDYCLLFLSFHICTELVLSKNISVEVGYCLTSSCYRVFKSLVSIQRFTNTVWSLERFSSLLQPFGDMLSGMFPTTTSV